MNEDMTVRRLFMFETAEDDTYTAYYAPAIGVIRIRVKYKNAHPLEGRSNTFIYDKWFDPIAAYTEFAAAKLAVQEVERLVEEEKKASSGNQ